MNVIAVTLVDLCMTSGCLYQVHTRRHVMCGVLEYSCGKFSRSAAVLTQVSPTHRPATKSSKVISCSHIFCSA